MLDRESIEGLGRIVRPWAWNQDSSGRFGYGGCDGIELADAMETDYLLPEYCGFSDYSGSPVERANAEAFMEMYGNKEHIFMVYGGYGTEQLAIRLDAITDEILEILNELQDYPCVDDEKLSQLEMEIENESLPGILSNLTRELRRKFGDDDGALWDAIEDCENFEPFLREKMEKLNIYPEFESAVSCYIDVDKVAKSTTIEELKAFLGMGE